MFKDYIWNTKLGRFNIIFDTQNISLGIEIDWSKPFSIDIYLPFIKFGWQMSKKVEVELYPEQFKFLWDAPIIPSDLKVKFEIKNNKEYFK